MASLTNAEIKELVRLIIANESAKQILLIFSAMFVCTSMAFAQLQIQVDRPHYRGDRFAEINNLRRPVTGITETGFSFVMVRDVMVLDMIGLTEG